MHGQQLACPLVGVVDRAEAVEREVRERRVVEQIAAARGGASELVARRGEILVLEIDRDPQSELELVRGARLRDASWPETSLGAHAKLDEMTRAGCAGPRQSISTASDCIRDPET